MVKRSFVCSLVVPALLLGLNYTLEDIQSYSLAKPAVCIDTALNLYLVGNTPGNDSVKYITKQSGPWQVYAISFTCVPGMNYNCRPSAALGPDGSLHILYRVTGGTYGWPVYTNNSGGSFTSGDTLTHNGSESTYNYGIAVDGLNHAHVVCEIYTGSSRVQYYYPYTDSQLVIASNAGKPTIAVGPNNVVHIAYAAPTSGSKIYYTNNASGSFSAAVLVSDSFGTDPSIAVDTLGFAHIAFANGAWNTASDLFYATNKTGAFQTSKVVATPGIGEDYAQIALSRQQHIAIIFWSYRSSPAVSYVGCATKRYADAAFTVDSVGPAIANPSFGAITWNDRGLAIDRAGYLHFGYYGASGVIYAKSQTPIAVQEVTKLSPDAARFAFKNLRSPTRAPLAIAYERSPSCEVTMSIYDILGRTVRDFGTVQTGCTMWDGKDGSGASVGHGVYIVRADVRDTETGVRSQATVKLVIID